MSQRTGVRLICSFGLHAALPFEMSRLCKLMVSLQPKTKNPALGVRGFSGVVGNTGLEGNFGFE